jgi:pyruvate dehydrogenase phosphatase
MPDLHFYVNLSLITFSNFPMEDTAGLSYAQFSNTLNFYCFGVFDGHNGPWTATFLNDTLSQILIYQLADLYSKHAATSQSQPIDHAVPVFELSNRNPGDPPDPVPTAEEIDQLIKDVFRHVDDLVVHSATQIALGLDDAAYAALSGLNLKDLPGRHSLPAFFTPKHLSFPESVDMLKLPYSGACAVVGIFNTSERSLRVALTGDCRAVLGRRVPGPSKGQGSRSMGNRFIYETHHLTVDQNAKNFTEAARLSALHPDEPELLKDNRVLGWGPARAFGDGVMKWSRELQQRLHEDFLGERPRQACKTPPYFTAEPVVTTTEGIRKGDFVVFASDGLWDCLSSEEVVGLVGLWLEQNGVEEQTDIPGGGKVKVLLPMDEVKVDPNDQPASSRNEDFLNDTAKVLGSLASAEGKPILPSELPVIYPPDYKDTTPMYKYWHREKRFACKDINAATHLARNALGGVDSDLGTALLSLQMPRSRRFR